MLSPPRQLQALPPATSGDAAAPVPVEDATTNVIVNYGYCHENAARLAGWIEWYREQVALRPQ